MLSTLDSLSSSPGSTPGWGHCVKSWEMQFTLTVPLHPGVQMLTGELNAGVKPAIHKHPVQGEEKYPWSLNATETGINSGLMGHLARIET